MNTNKNIKKLTINALLLGIGAMLHQFTPTLGLPMQPDFSLAMLFIILILNKKDYKTCLISGIATGIFTAMTTKFPGGQLPNLLDKVITANIVYMVLIFIDSLKVIKAKDSKSQALVEAMIILPIGTLVSGFTFLYSASIIAGLPGSFGLLFVTTVIPATFINLFAGLALFKIISVSLKRASLTV